MRPLVIALLLATAACSKVSSQQRAPDETSFDGAQVSDAAAIVAHGDRLTQVLGCKGCHTPTLTGQNFLGDMPQYGVLYASNLTQVLPRYSDAQIEQVIRRGVHPTRKELWVMPSQVFQNLSNADMKALLAYLRTLHPSGSTTPPPRFTPAGMKFIAAQHVEPVAQRVIEDRAKPLVDLGPRYGLGRYLASVTCAECHGSDLTGIKDLEPGINTPDLVVAGGYSRGDFERLMTSGVPIGGRKLRIMGDVAKERFPHFTPHERDALYAYLEARAGQPH
jgi:cytochrome c553